MYLYSYNTFLNLYLVTFPPSVLEGRRRKPQRNVRKLINLIKLMELSDELIQKANKNR
jgi:hypothetical protein